MPIRDHKNRTAVSSALAIGGITAALAAAIFAMPGIGEDAKPSDPAKTGPRTPEEQRRLFRLPPGFEIELVAAEPYVRKPININFDHRGRLWVTESVEYPFAANDGDKHRDTVRILEWTKKNQPADEVTTFASGLDIPIGVLPHQDGAIVFSIPDIYRFHDADGDGRAERRESLYGAFGTRDTHGMTGEFTWGFDGWVYACHGYINTSRIRGMDGSEIVMNSGNVYRFKPDGSRVEQFTWGQVNPFGLAFDPLGNLYSCDCHSQPVYQLLRGGYYPSFNKPNDGLGFGPPMTRDDHGSTAIAGIAYYAADHFPPAYRDTVFIGNVLTNRINQDRVVWNGATPKAVRQPDFLICDDPWFRPVDIKLGPDGALYIADFYNRIIGHYEVPLTHPGRDRERGRIWRIVYRGTDGKVAEPKSPRTDWSRATADELVGDLAHPNLTVRMLATNQLVERGGTAGISAAVRVLDTESTPTQRIHALWVLERQRALDDSALARATTDKDAAVRIHAMRILTERQSLTEPQYALVSAGLKDRAVLVRRCAVEVLGRHPRGDNLRLLLEFVRRVSKSDTHLRYAARMALRDQLKTDAAWAFLESQEWPESEQRAVADVAPGVTSPSAAAFLLRYMQRYPEPLLNRVRYVAHIARYGSGQVISGELLAILRGDRAATARQRLELWRALQQGTQARGGSLSTEARDWGVQIVRELISSPYPADQASGIELAGTLKAEFARPLITGLLMDASAPDAVRLASLAALAAMDRNAAVPVLGSVLGNASAPLPLRERAAILLSDANRAEAVTQLLNGLPTAPDRVALAIARGVSNSGSGSAQLMDLVASGKTSARLLQDPAVQMRILRSGVPNARERVIELTRELPTDTQRLDKLLAQRRSAFARFSNQASIGAAVYEKHCAACHQLGGKGSKVGPQLDGIGARGFDRLAEDILDPNRNVDPAFRSTTLGLADGRIVTGLVLREEGEVLMLADEQGTEVRVRKSEIEDTTLSPLSPMPSNFTDRLSEGEFLNLMAFLLNKKSTPAASDVSTEPNPRK